MRLSQVARQLNVGTSTILDVLGRRGFEVENSPNAKITGEQFEVLAKEFKESALDKREASSLTIGKKHSDTMIVDGGRTDRRDKSSDDDFFVPIPTMEREPPAKKEETAEPARESAKTEEVGRVMLAGTKVLGKIELDKKGNPIPTKTQPPQAATLVAVETKEVKVAEPVRETLKEEPAIAAPVAEKQPVAVAPTEPPAIPVPVAIKDEPKAEAEPTPTPKTATQNTTIQTPTQTVPPPTQKPAEESTSPTPVELVKARGETLKGLSVVGKIELPADRDKRRKDSPTTSAEGDRKKKRKRKRLKSSQPETAKPVVADTKARTPTGTTGTTGTAAKPADAAKAKPAAGKRGGRNRREEVSTREVQDQLRATLNKMGGRGSRGKLRGRRGDNENATDEPVEVNKLRVTEFISANDLASFMDVPVNDVISVCLNLGMFVSINQRLDAEAITIIADEFDYEVEFISAEEEIDVRAEVPDLPESLVFRAPIVTIMGHVDHGKTSLLDYIRKAKVASGEAGGITQHIGAYDVIMESGKRITFLDTPGHEAFTAMRARGAKITDVAIIVVAADDNVMPQTKEAINHAQVAGVPIVIAINKVDKAGANPEKIREELSQENVLVEEWGGKYQSQEISAKTGQGIDALLEKVLLEAEIQELKANPNKKAIGTVVEAALDKGRGYVATMMVQAGTMRVGDIILAGAHYGRVKAMLDHRGQKLKTAGPSTPVQVLGLGGAPQAGEKFAIMETEREAREIANKREQILREQTIRTRRHITLDEIGRRLAIGSFRELNIIVKGDVDGSVEALSDSLLRLSTEEVQVRILHKGVGQISESDVLLASAADAIVVGFQVRPSVNARRLAEQEEIEIRMYSIIYDAINEVKDAMEGMLAPTLEEIIMGTVEVRDVFKISKIGTVAGCMVIEGSIKRNNKIRIIRDGIVMHTGDIDALKRFKDDVNEVKTNYECGLSVKGFHDILTGDLIESFEQRETKRTL